jgi:hypothetical protein
MSEFTFLYRGRRTFDSPEQGQKHLQQWRAWFKDLTDQGHIKLLGHPLEASGKVVSGTQRIVTDGPYPESKDVVGGYTIIEAQNLAQAAELAKGCPILEVGGSVEVRPVQQL